MRYKVTHTTGYSYSTPASLSLNEVRLEPRPCPCQEVLSYDIKIDPVPQHLQSYQDFFGNTVHHFMVQHPHTELSITSTSSVQTKGQQLPSAETTPPWEEVRDIISSGDGDGNTLNASRFLYQSPFIPTGKLPRDFALLSFTPGKPILQAAIDLTHRIFSEFSYDKTASTIDTTIEQLLQSRKGVCQDFAHLAVSALRSIGLAARYISGYLETLPPPDKPKLIGADASHAWFSFYLPGYGWIDLDPTNNQPADETYITIAWGRDYGDVAPIKGVVLGGGHHTLSIMVDVIQESGKPSDEAVSRQT